MVVVVIGCIWCLAEVYNAGVALVQVLLCVRCERCMCMWGEFVGGGGVVSVVFCC